MANDSRQALVTAMDEGQLYHAVRQRLPLLWPLSSGLRWQLTVRRALIQPGPVDREYYFIGPHSHLTLRLRQDPWPWRALCYRAFRPRQAYYSQQKRQPAFTSLRPLGTIRLFREAQFGVHDISFLSRPLRWPVRDRLGRLGTQLDTIAAYAAHPLRFREHLELSASRQVYRHFLPRSCGERDEV